MRIIINGSRSFLIGSRSAIRQLGDAYSCCSAMKKKIFLLPGFVLALLLMGATTIQAANHYVRQGATGSNNGSDWINAYTSLPTTLVRGDTYYIADGAYGGYTFNNPVSGTSIITIKKATVSDHGTSTGWSDLYGDGQASFTGDFVVVTDYFIIDGQTRNESAWNSASSYGFHVPSFYVNSLSFGSTGDHVTVRYVDVGGTVSDNFSEGHPDWGFYFGGFGQVVTGWTISHCYIHNVDLPFQMASVDQITIENNWIGPNWQKEVIRGQIRSTNIIIRHNILRDGCQAVAGDPPDNRVGCTAPIAIWDGGPGSFDVGAIYGNVISTTKGTHYSDGCIFIGGDGGGTAAGSAANNWVIYNNTFHGVQDGMCTIRFPGSHTNDIARNNIWYGLGSGVVTGCSANTCENNSVITSNQFVDLANGNFRLSSATAAGTTLSFSYNMDMDGTTRGADGVWDRGAFEFQTGSPQLRTPNTPSSIQIH